jgi:hypothetical protein
MEETPPVAIYCARYPPSTARHTPVTQLASSLAKKSAGPTMSSGSPSPFSGCVASIWAFAPGLLAIAEIIGESVTIKYVNMSP